MSEPKYLSVCSGIEAATVAWHPLGWTPVAFSEVEKFPCAVLKHHYPSVPNWGDMTKFKEWPDESIDLLVGGTPCQSFSTAGLRRGLDDPRGNLMFIYLAIARRYKPCWIVWENVPGVLSSNNGRDFGAFLGGLAQCGYGFAYRVLDAQFVRTHGHRWAVPQRRRRVFVVGYFGDWRRAAAVLFDSESLRGNPPPRRKTGERVAPTISGGAPFSRTGNERVEAEALIVAFSSKDYGSGSSYDHSPIAYGVGGISHCIRASASRGDKETSTTYIQHQMRVRRLMPIECERLQGFSENYTNIPGTSDTARYKALGNSMAVNVMRAIGDRIQMVENLSKGAPVHD